MLCAGLMSRDVEIRKQIHISLKFAEFPNQSPSTNYALIETKRDILVFCRVC